MGKFLLRLFDRIFINIGRKLWKLFTWIDTDTHTDAQTGLNVRVKVCSPEMTEYENTDIHEDKGLYTDLRN